MDLSLAWAGRAVALALVCFSAVSGQSPKIVVTSLDWDPTVIAGSLSVSVENAPVNSRVMVHAFIPDSGWLTMNKSGFLCYPFRPPFTIPSTHRATKFNLRLVREGPADCANFSESIPPNTVWQPYAELTVTRAALYAKTVRFSGYDWAVKDSRGVAVGPGPSIFCESNSVVDSAGKLHMKIAANCSSEVILKKLLGYGTYRFRVETPFAFMHPNAVLGMFTWSEDADQALFDTPGTTFMVAGAGVPMTNDERVRLNLYPYLGGSTPAVQEMVISSFEFIPSTTTGFGSSGWNLTQVPAAGMHVPTLKVDQPGAWSFGTLPAEVRALPPSGNGPGTVDFTVEPNWSPNWRVFRGYVGPRAWEIQQPGAPGTLDQRTVWRLYIGILGRVPADEERDFHVVKALHQGTSVADLTTNFFSTPEFQEAGRFAAGLYLGLLCRDPEYKGWLLQRSVLSSGAVSQRQLVTNFFGTPEAGLLYGGVSKVDFVKTIYRCALGREPADFEIQSQAALLDVSLSRTDFAYSILKSQEFQLGSNRRLTAFLLYAAVLGRDGSESEKAGWANVLQSTPLRDVVAAFVNSPEFGLGLQ